MDQGEEKEFYIGNNKREHIRLCVSYLSSTQLLFTEIMEMIIHVLHSTCTTTTQVTNTNTPHTQIHTYIYI